jgi:uncharacterized coiled-coil protein SlyX
VSADPQRLQRLEESQAFAEHAIEQLSAELAALSKRLHESTARIARLERRLDQLAAGDDDAPGDDQPPTDATSVH